MSVQGMQRTERQLVGDDHNKETVQELLYYLLHCEEYSHKFPCQVVLKKLSPDG